MKLKRYSFIIALTFMSVFLSGAAHASTGFVTSPIWLTPESAKEGDMVTLSVVFRNAEMSTLSGMVLFYDADTLLSKKPLTVLTGQIGSASTSFKLTAGTHQFSATMEGVGTLTTTGKIMPVVLAAPTVKLPSKVVSKKIGLTAQAGDATNTASEKPILNQINTAEESVLSVIPQPTKNAVAGIATNLDAWRQTEAANFSDGKAAAQKTLDDLSKQKTVNVSSVLGTTKVTESAAPSGPLDTPFAYVRLFFFVALVFLFSNPLVFYIGGIVLLVIIVRFIIRRISRRKKSRSLNTRAGKGAER